jgi:hypothetical protein
VLVDLLAEVGLGRALDPIADALGAEVLVRTAWTIARLGSSSSAPSSSSGKPKL